MSQKIGFVGIGRMGANMARNLKDRGYTISSVNDINKDAAAELAQELGPDFIPATLPLAEKFLSGTWKA